MNKIILCGTDNALAITVPAYEDKVTRGIATLAVLSKIHSIKSLSAAWKRISSSDAFKRSELSTKDIVSELGEEFKKEVDTYILNWVIQKDMPVCVDTTSWTEEKKKLFAEKYGFTTVQDHMLLPVDQAESMAKDGFVTSYTGVDHMIINQTDHPELESQRLYRQAFCFCSKKGMKIDMPKARDICRNSVRKRREKVLPKLDVEVSKSLARVDQPAALKAEERREYWRKITENPAIEKAKTIEELDKFIADLPVE